MSIVPPSAPTQEEKETPKEFEIELLLRFVKLSNGEDIICQVIEGVGNDHLNLMVCHPIRIMEMENMESAYGLVPWIPFTRQQVIAINRLTVITVTTVMESVEQMYTNHLREYLSQQIVEVEEEPKNSWVKDLTDEVNEMLDEDEKPAKRSRCAPKTWVN